jgi:hypothetical protein
MPMLRKSMPKATVAKLCRKNSTPPVASSWLIGGADRSGSITRKCSSAPRPATSRMAIGAAPQ